MVFHTIKTFCINYVLLGKQQHVLILKLEQHTKNLQPSFEIDLFPFSSIQLYI